MATVLVCPTGHRLKVPNKFAGQRIICPVCDARLDVPGVARVALETTLEAPSHATPESPLDFRPHEANIRSEFTIQEIDSPRLTNQLSRSQRHALVALLLSVASAALALLCLLPSLVEQGTARQLGLRLPDTWSYFVILVAMIQMGMALLAARVPDWSTQWLLSITATAVSSFYAAGLALTMFADPNHDLVRQLGLLDEATRYRVQPWCFLVVCLGLLLAYACGRSSVGWHRWDSQRPFEAT